MAEQLKDRLKRLRKKRKLSIPDMVEKTGLKDTTYRNYEDGSSKNPTMSRAIKLADALGVSLDELMGRKSPDADDNAGAADYVMDADGSMRSVKTGEVPKHAVMKFIGLTVNGQPQVALDLLVIGRSERTNVEIDVSDLKVKGGS